MSMKVFGFGGAFADFLRRMRETFPAAVAAPVVVKPVDRAEAPAAAPSPLIGAAGATAKTTTLAAPMTKGTISKKPAYTKKIEELYTQNAAKGITFTVANMRQYFGVKDNGKVARSLNETHAAFSRFIVKTDPITGGPITFLGRPITGGVNAYMLPMLKAAEFEIAKSGFNYRPAGPTILGFGFRGMMIKGKESTDILSSHSAGLSMDMDAGSNGAKYDGGGSNRGNIPDHIVEALVNAGFVWGGVRRSGFNELGDDPMHFQQSLHPTDARYQEILATSPIAKRYSDALAQNGALIPLPPKASSV